MYGEYLKCLISFTVTPIEVLFIPSPFVFYRLHDDIIFCCIALVPEIIKEIATASEHKCTIQECETRKLYLSNMKNITKFF